MLKDHTLKLLGGAALSIAIAPLAVAQDAEQRGQITEDPLVPAAEATAQAYLGPQEGADAGGLADAAAWFNTEMQTLEVSWTIEYTGETDVAAAAVYCPAEGEMVEAPEDPAGVSVESLVEVISIDATNAATEGALEGTTDVSEAVFNQIENGECVLSLSTDEVEHALTGQIL